MTTRQNYVGKENYAKTLELTVENPAQPTPTDEQPPVNGLTAEDFINQHPNLIGLPADQLDKAIQPLLAEQPLCYHSLQDGVDLLRGLLGEPLDTVDAHLALLIRGGHMVGLACINLNDELPGEEVPNYLQADDLDSRYLMSIVLKAGVNRLLMVSILNNRPNALEEEERVFVNSLGQSLELIDVELIDWLVMTQAQTRSLLGESDQSRLTRLADQPYLNPRLTAQKQAAQFTPSYPEWQDQFLEQVSLDPEARDELFKTLALLRKLHERTVPTPFIDLLFSQWISEPTNDLEKHRYDIRSLFGHISLMLELQQQFECLNLTTGLIDKQDQAGEGQGHE